MDTEQIRPGRRHRMPQFILAKAIHASQHCVSRLLQVAMIIVTNRCAGHDPDTRQTQQLMAGTTEPVARLISVEAAPVTSGIDHRALGPDPRWNAERSTCESR